MIQVLDTSTRTRADRLHAALSTTFEGVFSAIVDASFDRRVGHVRLLAPRIPVRVFNGALVESEPCSGIRDSIREVEERGLPCGVQVRAETHPDIEEELARLGFSVRAPMPGMTASPDELAAARMADLEITRVANEEGLAQGAQVAAEAGGAPVESMQPLFAPGLLELPGFAVYLGRVGGDAVTVAMAYRTDDDVGIFNVGTPPRHRRAVTPVR